MKHEQPDLGKWLLLVVAVFVGLLFVVYLMGKGIEASL